MKTMALTGTGGAASIGFTRSIRDSGKKIRVVGTDANLINLPFSEADVNYIIPRANEPDYLEKLNGIIDAEGAEFIHAQPDPEVNFISKNRDKIKAKTLLPSHDAVEICQNKFKSYEAWSKAGIVLPKTIFINSEDDLKKAFTEIQTPFWIRAVKGAGGRGSFIVKEYEQAKVWIDHWKGWGNFVASELLPGRLLTWQSLWYEGELVCAQGRERLSWGLAQTAITGVTGMTGVARNVSIPELDEISEKAIHAAEKQKPHGIYGVDLKCNTDGVPCPTEINIGRFFTTIHFFTKAGLNMPSMLLDLAEGNVPSLPKKLNPIEGEFFWIRTVDAKPAFLTREQLRQTSKNDADVDRILQPDSSVKYFSST